MNKSDLIYLDHSASTPIDEQVAKVMYPYLKSDYKFGNPGRVHWAGISGKHTSQKQINLAAYIHQATLCFINNHDY